MRPLRLVQISDFHFTKITWNPLRLFSKRLLGNLNWVLARKSAFSTVQLDALPSFLKTLNLDRILLGGDFTTTSLLTEFTKAQEFVDKLPFPWIAVPGNHDRYTFSACREKVFYRYFPNPKDPSSSFTLEKHGVEAHVLNPNWRLIALDTSRATHFYTSSGLFSKEQETHLRTLLEMIPQNENILLFNHYPFFENDIAKHSLIRGDMLEAIVKKDVRIKAYLHGHTHRHTIANLQPSGLPLILDGGCSADIHKGSWNLLELDDKGINVCQYKWREGWTPARQERIEWTR